MVVVLLLLLSDEDGVTGEEADAAPGVAAVREVWWWPLLLLLLRLSQAAGIIQAYGGRTALALWATTLITAAIAGARIGGGWLVDTPGVRSFGLGTVTDRDLWRHVPELAGLDCALDDCMHDGEPGCQVAQAPIDPVRLAAYRRLVAALREGV